MCPLRAGQRYGLPTGRISILLLACLRWVSLQGHIECSRAKEVYGRHRENARIEHRPQQGRARDAMRFD